MIKIIFQERFVSDSFFSFYTNHVSYGNYHCAELGSHQSNSLEEIASQNYHWSGCRELWSLSSIGNICGFIIWHFKIIKPSFLRSNIYFMFKLSWKFLLSTKIKEKSQEYIIRKIKKKLYLFKHKSSTCRLNYDNLRF